MSIFITFAQIIICSVMKFVRYIIAFVAIALLTCMAHARTVEIKMSQCAKPLVDNIKKVATTLSYDDTLILYFDKSGKYVIDGTIRINCNVVIKGVDSQSTKIIVKEGFANGKSKFTDDCFFRIKGNPNHKISAEICDLCFEIEPHKGILWENSEKLLVKIWDADGVLVDNVVSKMRDAEITNLDLRECSNVLVQNCYFENYNNCEVGGCLWSRGAQKNIHIVNNVFRKYGKDEVLGCWGGVHETDFEIKNIVVENNEFYLDNITGSKLLDVRNFIAFNHTYNEKAQTYCTLDSILFKNNKIIINAPLNRILMTAFCKYAIVKNLEISYNEIVCTSKCSRKNSFMNDIDIISELGDNINVKIDNNYLSSKGEILSDDKNSGHTFLSCQNANISATNNIIENDYPQRFVWCHEGSLRLNLDNNSVSNIYTSATLSSSKTIDNVLITATNNIFSGDTRIYCRNVKTMDLVYKNNVFNSSNYHFFLHESANQTSIEFDGNIVNAQIGKGVFYANYSNKDYKFSKAIITNNTFNGLNKKSIEGSLKQSKKLTLRGNIYR